jgi:signal peptidase II
VRVGAAWRRLSGLGVALVIFLADRAIKQWMVTHLVPGQSVPVLPPVLWITLAENSGAAFGLLQHRHWLLVAVAVLVIGGALTVLWRRRHPSWILVVGLGLVLGGAAGNLWDRLITGRVVDYIDVRFWPVFNLADSAIVVGMGLLLMEAWRRDDGGR